jgi:hypothetical protein
VQVPVVRADDAVLMLPCTTVILVSLVDKGASGTGPVRLRWVLVLPLVLPLVLLVGPLELPACRPVRECCQQCGGTVCNATRSSCICSWWM